MLAGAEVINPTLNTNFSRSLLFFDSEPLTHTGVRAAYADGRLYLHGRRQQRLEHDLNFVRLKDWRGQRRLRSGKQAVRAFRAMLISARNEAFDAEKTLIDVVATYNVTSALSLGVELRLGSAAGQGLIDDAGILHDASWNGAALYVNYAINDQFRVSPCAANISTTRTAS